MVSNICTIFHLVQFYEVAVHNQATGLDHATLVEYVNLATDCKLFDLHLRQISHDAQATDAVEVKYDEK